MDHIGLPVADLDAAKRFYGACLSVLGWELRDYGERGAAFRKLGTPTFYLSPAGDAGRNVHLAFRARSREEVDAFHRVALEHGATDHGAPGLRPDYAKGYYAAFVLDPAANNLEAVFHEED